MSQQNHRRLKQVKKTATSEFLEGSSDVTNNGDAGDVTCNVVALRDSRERWAVVPYVSLPDFLRDNEYLLKGHRPQLPTVKECFKSMFRHHTETWNIWTHFFGIVLFLIITVYMLTRPSSEAAFDKKIVFSLFFVGVIFCWCCSTLYHTFECHSPSAKKLFSKLDYIGIIVKLVFSYPPWLHYSFRCRHIWKYFYFTSIGICGIACIVILMKDRFCTPKYRWLRAGMFICLGLVGVIPFIHYVLSEEGGWDMVFPLQWLVLMAAIYIVGALIYGARIPERFWPGNFDIMGHSHQIMHMFSIAGALTSYYGANKLAQHRIDNKLMCT